MTAIKKNLEDIAADVIRAVSRLESDAKEQLETLDNDTESKQTVLAKRRADIIKGVETGYSRIRQEYGRKVDAIANSLRRIGDTVKQPKPSADDAAAAQILSVLQISPMVTQSMLDSASQSVGGSQFAQDTLRQIAQRHGLIVPQMQPIDKHLSGDDLYLLADDVQGAFRAYFDSRTAFIDPDARQDIHDNYEARQQLLTQAKRGNSEFTLRNVGNMIDFNGNTQLQAEFEAAESAVE